MCEEIVSEYIDPQIIYIGASLEHTFKLGELAGQILQRIEFPSAIGEVELFLDNISLGITTAGKLTFPSPETRTLKIPIGQMGEEMADQNYPVGFPIGCLISPVKIKIHPKNDCTLPKDMKFPVLLWWGNIWHRRTNDFLDQAQGFLRFIN